MSLKKEIEEDTNKWKHTMFMDRKNKMSMLPKAVSRFSTIPIKTQMTCFTVLQQIFQKFIWNPKRPCIATEILRKKNKGGGTTVPSVKL